MVGQKSTDSWYLRGVLFVVLTPLLALALLLAATAAQGDVPSGKTLSEPGNLLMPCIVLLPFVIIGMAAGATSKRGALIGWCTWVGGVTFAGGTYLVGYLGYRQALQEHAWTGASLTMGFIICAAIPAAILGSLIGLAVGLAVAKFRPSHVED
jgi:hypothetical protein